MKLPYPERLFENGQPICVVVKEKYGEHYYMAKTVEGLYEICLTLVKQRIMLGYYNECDNKEFAVKTVKEGIGRDAYTLLNERSVSEYEGFFIDQFAGIS